MCFADRIIENLGVRPPSSVICSSQPFASIVHRSLGFRSPDAHLRHVRTAGYIVVATRGKVNGGRASAGVGDESRAREALARRIKSRLAHADNPATDHDVSIVGGGVAALTLALEIRRARPTTRILIIEPNAHPVPEITHTVGESTVEVSAHYLRDRLGLGDHLSTAQIRKMGLRMFFSHERNTDIAQRMELGSSSFVPQVTYQIDRGRLENELHRRCLAEGVDIARGRVRSVEFGCRATSAHDFDSERRRRHADHGTVGGRRVGPEPDAAPATGSQAGQRARLQRGMVPRRHRDRRRPMERRPDLAGRASIEGDRAMSTNHLMGEGYWVWLIRLASGATSVGIVADPAFHAFDEFNTLAKAKAWLREHEPQCAAVLAEHAHLIKDFRVMKKYSHGATKVFDGARPLVPHRRRRSVPGSAVLVGTGPGRDRQRPDHRHDRPRARR